MINIKILFSLLTLTLVSCAYNQTQIENKLGQSLNVAKKNQTVNVEYHEGKEIPLVTSKEISSGYNGLIQNKTISNSSAGKLDSNFNLSQ